MISLSYIAAYDPYHAIFRMLALLEADHVAFPVEVVRILDFYQCFPWLLVNLRPARDIPGQVKAHNQIKKKYQPSSYQITPDDAVLFKRMRSSQLAALNSLAANGYIDADNFKESVVQRTMKPLPAKLSDRVRRYVLDHTDLLAFLRSVSAVSLFGKDGLKERSGLEEYRYDNV